VQFLPNLVILRVTHTLLACPTRRHIGTYLPPLNLAPTFALVPSGDMFLPSGIKYLSKSAPTNYVYLQTQLSDTLLPVVQDFRSSSPVRHINLWQLHKKSNDIHINRLYYLVVGSPASQSGGTGFNPGRHYTGSGPSLLSIRVSKLVPATAEVSVSAPQIRPSSGTKMCALKMDVTLTLALSTNGNATNGCYQHTSLFLFVTKSSSETVVELETTSDHDTPFSVHSKVSSSALQSSGLREYSRS